MAPYERVTKDEFVLWANYGGGWEEEITEDTKDEIKQRLKEYRENAGQYSYKWTKRRVRIEPKVEPEPEVEKAQFYRIVRYFANDRARNYTVRARCTLEEAQAHCNDPETSSQTCTKPHNKRRTREYGPWFDGCQSI